MTSLILACYHHSPDVSIAHSLPFMHSWTILFWLFMIVFGLPLAIEARCRGGRAPIALWLYVLVALVLGMFAMGLTPPLFLLLPVFVFSAGHVLGAESGTAAFRSVTRATLVAMVLLVPIAYLRVRLQIGPLAFELLRMTPMSIATHSGLAITAVVGLAFLGRAAGVASAQATAHRSEWEGLRQTRRTQRFHRTPVAVQKHQACPLCWDLLLSPGRKDALSHCPECRTTLHRDCADELGCCPTLACKRRQQRKAPRRLPSDRLLTITKRPRLQPELMVIGVA